MIPKPSGGKRMLVVPTVLDRVIQQAVVQVLTPVIDPYFHPHSFGIRPGRSAHEAVEQHASPSLMVRCGASIWTSTVSFDRVGHDAPRSTSAFLAKSRPQVHSGSVRRLVCICKVES